MSELDGGGHEGVAADTRVMLRLALPSPLAWGVAVLAYRRGCGGRARESGSACSSSGGGQRVPLDPRAENTALRLDAQTLAVSLTDAPAVPRFAVRAGWCGKPAATVGSPRSNPSPRGHSLGPKAQRLAVLASADSQSEEPTLCRRRNSMGLCAGEVRRRSPADVDVAFQFAGTWTVTAWLLHALGSRCSIHRILAVAGILCRATYNGRGGDGLRFGRAGVFLLHAVTSPLQRLGAPTVMTSTRARPHARL